MAKPETKRLNVELTVDRYEQLSQYAEQRGVTISQATRDILEYYFYTRPLMEYVVESMPERFEDKLAELKEGGSDG